jgi:hypothetical protein
MKQNRITLTKDLYIMNNDLHTYRYTSSERLEAVAHPVERLRLASMMACQS